MHAYPQLVSVTPISILPVQLTFHLLHNTQQQGQVNTAEVSQNDH